MKQITIDELRKNLKNTIEKAAANKETFMVDTNGGKAVIISEDEWNAYMDIVDVCVNAIKTSFVKR